MRSLLLAVLLLAPAAPAWSRAGGGGGGGCFPAGTPIATINGEVPVEKVRPGDRVLAFSNDKLVQVEVKDFIQKKDRLIKIKTANGSVTATLEHPFLTRYGFTEVRELKKGDEVAVIEDGRRVWTRIKSLKTGGVAEVYNLEVAPPHTFIAGGFVVHNKGGSYGSFFGSSSYGSSYDSSYDDGYSGGYRSGYSYHRRRYSDPYIFVLAIVVLLIKGFGFVTGRSGSGTGSYKAAPVRERQVDGAQARPRAEQTREILSALSRRDQDFDPARLQELVKGIFFKVQLAWQARDYSTMHGAMMPSLLASQSAKAEAMKARGEVNMMEDLKVLSIDFVHVRCPREREGRAFTVLITASAFDYIVREYSGGGGRYGSLPASTLETAGRGREPQTFQEFWTFNQFNGNWALARIDQVGELDFMNAPNLPASPQEASSMPKAAAAQASPAGDAAYRPKPAAAPAASAPLDDNAFARGADLLRGAAPAAAALPQASPEPAAPPEDSHWDRQKMEIAATLAFESVYEAWGRNDSSLLSPEYVSAEALARLKRIMLDRAGEGISFEFKDLFARRAEVVLTSPAAKSRLHLDEFTARINATAVRAMLRNGKALHRDAAPEPFTEYWVFGRQNGAWKLRDILPRMDQQNEDRAKDGVPSPVQIEWYWIS